MGSKDKVNLWGLLVLCGFFLPSLLPPQNNQRWNIVSRAFIESMAFNIQRIGDAQNPDIVYYNLSIHDGKEVDEGRLTNPTATYNETRDTPLIKDASKYYFSIVRFQMAGAGITLPVFLPVIEPNQADPNQTIYQIGLTLDVNYTVGGIPYTNTFRAIAPITWVSQSTTAPTPSSLVGSTQDFTSDYYYAYTYDHVANLINTTYDAVWTDLNGQFQAWYAGLPGAGVPPSLTTEPPRIFYNPDTRRFILYTDVYGWGGAERTSLGSTADESFGMYFNSNTFGLLDSFPNEYEGGDLASQNQQGADGFAYEILIRGDRLGRNLYEDPTTTTRYWTTDQEWVSTGTLWSPIESIVFVSTLIPVVAEGTGQPIRFGTGNAIVPFTSQSAFTPIVTDIALPLDSADQYKEMITYIPSAEYRLASLAGSAGDIRSVDIQIFWKNRLDGNLIPLRLFNKSSVSVKIMFRRKDYLG